MSSGKKKLDPLSTSNSVASSKLSPAETSRTREAIFEAVFSEAIDAIVTINVDGRIQMLNRAAEALFGYTASELTGKNVKIIMPSPHRDSHDSYLNAYLTTGIKKIIGIGREAEGLRKDGSLFPVDIAISEVFVGNRRLFVGILRDITERKQTQEKLLQAERLAAIGQMVAGLAHESRNAFQRSLAGLELLELEIGGQSEAVDLVQGIRRAQIHIYNLYEEVRNFAAPVVLSRRRCDVVSLIHEIWDDLAQARKGKTILLKEINASELKECSIDRDRIGRVFRNILENAIDACVDPGVIQVAYEHVQGINEPAISIRIQDNGGGLEPDALERLFEPFFTTKPKGTGLGMAIAQRLVFAHDGQISVENSEEGGAEFRVVLPVR